MKPKSTPTEPSGGELSKIVVASADVGDALAAEPRVAPERAVVDRFGLGQAAGHERLEQPRLALGQRRRVGQPRGERRRHREDHMARLHRGRARDDAHAIAVLGDHRDRRLHHDALAQAVGDLLADDLRAAHEAALLRAPAGGDEPQEGAGGLRVAGGRRVLQHVEERHLLRVGAPDRLARGDEDRAGPSGSGPLRASSRRASSHPRPWPAWPSRARSRRPAWRGRRASASRGSPAGSRDRRAGRGRRRRASARRRR